MAGTEEIYALLREIRYPGLDRDIVSLNYIEAIEPDDDGYLVKVNIKASDQAAAQSIAEQVHQALSGAPVPCRLELTMPPPPEGHSHQDHASHGPDAGRKTVKIEDTLPGVKYKIAIASGKGGVGKSTVAVNLALALAKEGKRVGLLDADIYGPSVPTMLGIQDLLPEMQGEKVQTIPAHGIKVMSIGSLTNNTEPVIWRGPMASRALEQLITDIDWSDVDYLLFDMPPGTGDIQISLAQKAALAGSVIVTTPQDVALVDAIKGVRMFQKMDVPVLGIVENMSGFACPHCGEVTKIFPTGELQNEMAGLGAPKLAEIPIDPLVAGGGDSGLPIVIKEPESVVAGSFSSLAKNLISQLAGG